MNCQTAKSQLIDLVYPEGVVDPALQQHVDRCEVCRDELEQLNQAKQLLECFDADPVESLKQPATRRTTNTLPWRRSAQLLAMTFAAALGAVAGGFVVWQFIPTALPQNNRAAEIAAMQTQLTEVSQQLAMLQDSNHSPDEQSDVIAQQQKTIATLAAELKEIKRRQNESELSLAILRDDMKFFGLYVAKYTVGK